MNLSKTILVLLSGVPFCNFVFAEGSLKDVIKDGTVQGNVRAYYNTREYETKQDEAGFALGGALRAETGSFGGVKFGLGYYTAQDLGFNDSDPSKVNKRLGDDLEVLGEAYISLSVKDSTATAGRHKINTPFANAGDAFIVPFTFQGISLTNASVSNLKFEFNYIEDIKNRNSSEFVNVGKWSTGRYGLDEAEVTDGTLNVGVKYSAGPLKLEGWGTRFADLFDGLYLRGDYNFDLDGPVKPFVGIQYATQTDSGDSLLGTVDTNLFGVQTGAGIGKTKFILAHNSVTESEDAFRNGAFLAPYNFSTSPIFTNNMLQTVENTDSGSASKLTFLYKPVSSLSLKLSHAVFDFDNVADRDATDFDVTYKFGGYVDGLSLRYRLEIVGSDTASVKQTNHRFQTQFVF